MNALGRLVGTLARLGVWLLKREAMRDKEHRRENDTRDCMCEPCQWARGVEDDADAALEKWR